MQWRLWRAVRPLIGTVVGVGIFGLPYVFAQAGFGIATLELAIVALVSWLAFEIYSELLAANKVHTQFVGVVGHELGAVGKFVAGVSYFGTLWGTLLAYVIIGGQFSANLLASFTGWSVSTWQILFWFVASLCIFGGPLLVRKVQSIVVPFFILLIVGLVLFALPHVHTEIFTTTDWRKAAVPIGVLLFAFGGFGALPEMKDVLSKRLDLLRPAIIAGTVAVTILYLLFCIAILALTGSSTTPEAVEGLRFVSNGWPFLVVSCLGLLTVFTAFVSIGQSLTNTLLYDYRARFLTAWAMTVGVPLAAYLVGARNFIDIVGATGGILGGITGLVLLVAYEKARAAAHLSKYSLTIPQPVIALLFLVFVGMIALTALDLSGVST